MTRWQFKRANTYQDFGLAFAALKGSSLEFRTLWHGGATILKSSVIINQLA